MVFNQIFLKSHFFLTQGVKLVMIRNCMNGQNIVCLQKISRFGLKQYSTAFKWRSPVFSSRIAVNHMSTSSKEEHYQVVYTNPAEKTTVVSEISLNNSEKAHQSVLLNDTLTDSSSETFSATAVSSESSATEFIDIAENLHNEFQPVVEIVEPALSSLGLAGWSPVGLVQQWLEYLHIGCHMPWWIAIITSTIIARILLTPLLIKTQRNALNLSNYMPQLQFLQAKFGEARRSGNSMEASRYANEIMLYMKQHNINPLKNALWPLLQAPVFISFFLALRGMANAPVESMKEGGLSWTTDLTLADPYYVLPAIACGTLYVILKVGAESGIKMDNMKMAKYFVRAVPFIALPFCINFPSAILYYWCTNNFCTLIVVSILKIESVRKMVNLPKQLKLDPKFISEKKGFISGIKEAYEDQKILGVVEDRRRVDQIRFQKAGTGPVPRTYSYDPTKPRPASAAKGHKS